MTQTLLIIITISLVIRAVNSIIETIIDLKFDDRAELLRMIYEEENDHDAQ